VKETLGTLDGSPRKWEISFQCQDSEQKLFEIVRGCSGEVGRELLRHVLPMMENSKVNTRYI
jgi:hypothetical protein